MKQLQLQVATRGTTGKRAAGRVRRAGHVPAVIYGKSGSHSLSVDERALRMLLREAHGGAALVDLTDDQGTKRFSILQEVRRDPRTDRFLHVDFHEISANEAFTIEIPVHAVGEAAGIKEGGLLDLQLHKITVRCLPADLPSSIELDVSGLKLGQSIHIKEIPVMQGVTFVQDGDAVVVACSAPRALVAEAPATAAEAATESSAKVEPKKEEAKK